MVWLLHWPQLCRNSVNEWLTAIREYCQRFSIVQGHTRQLSTYFLEKAVPELCQWNNMAAQYYCPCFLAFFYNFHNMPQSSRPYQRIVKKAIPDNCQLIFGINLNQNFVNMGAMIKIHIGLSTMVPLINIHNFWWNLRGPWLWPIPNHD